MKLSIITINLNNRDGLKSTIESVIRQSYTSYEFIVIDGASTDGSVDIIKAFEGNISYWVSEQDGGIYEAMNKGIDKASGDYLHFLNSGDCYSSAVTLDRFFSYSFHEDLVYCNLVLLPLIKGESNQVFKYPERLTMSYLYENTLGHQATFIKRTLFDKGKYNEEYKIISDWTFFLQKIVFENCSYKYIDEDIVFFDQSGIGSNPHYYTMKKEERTDFLQKHFPKLVLDEFQAFFMLRKSELYESVVFLQRTTGLRKSIAVMVAGIVKCYKFFKRIESKT